MKALFFLTMITGLLMTDDSGWKKEYDKNGVKIYTRNAEGSSVKEYRGVVDVKAGVETCVDHLKDLEKFSKTSYKTTDAEIIKSTSDSEWILYCVVDFPWPYTDRDMVAKYKRYNLGNGIVKVKFYTVSGYVSEKEDYERMQNLSGSWLFEPLTEYTTRITHESKTPADGFPAWIVNMFILDAPKHIMPSFRTAVEK